MQSNMYKSKYNILQLFENASSGKGAISVKFQGNDATLTAPLAFNIS